MALNLPEKLINYSGYSAYRCYRMKNTTIQISDEMKKKIASLGLKNETYDQIIRRIYDAAIKTQFRELLFSKENTITIEEAIKEAKKKWPKSK